MPQFAEDKLVKAFTEATIKSISESCEGVNLIPKISYNITKTEPIECNIVSFMSIFGDAKGTIVFGVEYETAKYLAQKMLLTEEVSKEECIDVVKEMVNMIVGRAKSGIEQDYPDPRLDMNQPGFFVGKIEQGIWDTKSNSVICIPFVIQETKQKFILLVSLEVD